MKLNYVAAPALIASLTVAGCGNSGLSRNIRPAAAVSSAPTPAVAVAPVTASTTAPVPTLSSTPAVVATTTPPVPAYTAPPSAAYIPAPAQAHVPPPATALPPVPAGDGSYTNVDGKSIPDPVSAAAPPAGATAQCNDGTYSFSQHHSGTCSSHGGVASWL